MSKYQALTLRLIEEHGDSDVGIIFVYLLNVVKLKKFEWFLIPPDVPHAYLSGELVECMINSDNVVRGGLTPKLKDVKTLCEILPFQNPEQIPIKQGVVVFEDPQN